MKSRIYGETEEKCIEEKCRRIFSEKKERKSFLQFRLSELTRAAIFVYSIVTFEV